MNAEIKIKNRQIELLTGRFKGMICTVVEENEKTLTAKCHKTGLTVTLPKASSNQVKYYKEVDKIKGMTANFVIMDELGGCDDCKN